MSSVWGRRLHASWVNWWSTVHLHWSHSLSVPTHCRGGAETPALRNVVQEQGRWCSGKGHKTWEIVCFHPVWSAEAKQKGSLPIQQDHFNLGSPRDNCLIWAGQGFSLLCARLVIYQIIQFERKIMLMYFQRFPASLLGNAPSLELIWKLEKPIELGV